MITHTTHDHADTNAYVKLNDGETTHSLVIAAFITPLYNTNACTLTRTLKFDYKSRQHPHNYYYYY